MRLKNITGALVTDLGISPPFAPQYSKLVAVNLGAAAVSVQESDASTGPFSDCEGGDQIAVNQGAEIVVKKRYLALEQGAGTVILLTN